MAARDLFKKIDGDVTRYRVELQFRHLIVGGVPSDRSTVEGWIRSRMDLGDAAIAELVAQTVAEVGVLTPDEAVQAVLGSELAPSVNRFKRDPDTRELVIEGRQVKAALKEYANIAYPGTRYPGKPAAKAKGSQDTSIQRLSSYGGLKKAVSERVFVDDIFIGLGVKVDDVAAEPTEGAVAWIEERVKHVSTPQGPRSALNRVEVVLRPSVAFTVSVQDDFLPQEAWGRIWEIGEGIGLGADRGRSDGTFSLETWERIK